MSNYPTNLTEKQWQVIKNIVESQERSKKTSLREILNGFPERGFLSRQERMPMADASCGLCSLANDLLLFPQVESRRRMGRIVACTSWPGKEVCR